MKRRVRASVGKTWLLGVCACWLLSGVDAAAQYPAAWINQFCPGTDPRGPFVNCWVALPRFATAVEDPLVSSDESHKSNPQPRGADIYDGEQANQNSIWYAWDPDADVVMFRKRLDGTPTLGVNGGNSPPGDNASGPFKSNTAWNFVMDFNGDGWGDIVGATDGNTGKNQDPTDTIQLGYANTPGSQEIVVLGNGGSFDPAVDLCTVGGRFLFHRKANWAGAPEPDPVPGCPTQLSPNCDFIFTRTLNVCPPSAPAGCTTDDANFFLDMQFPRGAFDNCLGPDDDSDGVGGAQLLEPDTPFTLCVTTSTQPNDFTNKDLALDDAYIMGEDKPLPCSDRCTLANGCVQEPFLTDLDVTCGVGPNNSPIGLTAEVLDTAGVSAGVVVDSISNVQFFYTQEDGSGGFSPAWVPALPAAGSSNPVTSPSGEINRWSMLWDTTLLPTSPSSRYRIRVVITDEQGNTYVDLPKSVDIAAPGCAVQNTPVTLAYFNSKPEEGGLTVEWSTATETANLGFNLYAKTNNGWIKVNPEPVSSFAPDSAEPHSYQFRVEGIQPLAFAVEDIDVRGNTDIRGPFTVGQTYGAPVSARPVDWAAVRRETRERKGPARGSSFKLARLDALSSPVAEKGGFPETLLLVDEPGLYRVTYEDLMEAGFDFTGAHAYELALFRQGRSTPIRVGGGSKFGPGSFVEFYGEGLNTLYTDTMAYRLKVDKKQALRVPVDRKKVKKGDAVSDWHLEESTIEKNRRYSLSSPLSDPWYDTSLVAWGANPAELSFDLQVDNLAAGQGPASAWVTVYGGSILPANPDHHLVVEFNGVALADELFDERDVRIIRMPLPQGLLRQGSNTLTLRLPADLGVIADLIFVESYGISYPRKLSARDGRLGFRAAGEALRVDSLPNPEVVAYRITAGGPELLERVEVEQAGDSWSAMFPGGPTARYAVSTVSALKRPGIEAARPQVDISSGRADYLMIAHPNFVDKLGALAAAREAQGMVVRVVNVEDVYAQYSHDVFDANAIRAYVAWAVRNMGTRYVLLVGGDTYDYKDYLGLGSVSFVPSLYAATGSPNQTASGSVVRFAPVDPLYGDVDFDKIPDVAVGRLPVRTAAELANAIEKTLQYAAKDYRKTAVFASDASHDGLWFGAHSDEFAWSLGRDWSVRKAYIDHLGVEGAKDRLVESINAGSALTSFVGHSSPTLWSFSRLFTADNALQLDNQGKPTMVVQWGCFNNYYVLPSYDTLGHNFLLQPSGAAAVLGSSTQSNAPSAQALSEKLAPLLGQPGMTVGDAMVRAKRELAAAQPDLLNVILGWTLLGDPALVVEP